MKAFYICDKKRGCRSCGEPWNECKHTADAKHAKNKDKRERYFVIYPNMQDMEEVETLQEMEEKAEAVRAAINSGQCYF